MSENMSENVNTIPQGATKFCKHCGKQISEKAVICPMCGCQVEEIGNSSNNNAQPIIINNNNSASSSSSAAVGGVVVQGGRAKNKWVALLLCIFLGYFGVHRFYEGKILSGLLYLFTGGIGCVGWIIDIIILLTKPNPYYV